MIDAFDSFHFFSLFLIFDHVNLCLPPALEFESCPYYILFIGLLSFYLVRLTWPWPEPDYKEVVF
jgi:hypothetical protein